MIEREAIPVNELMRFETFVYRQADGFEMEPGQYLRKVWYHETAARFGEYIALTLLEQLIRIAPPPRPTDEEASE